MSHLISLEVENMVYFGQNTIFCQCLYFVAGIPKIFIQFKLVRLMLVLLLMRTANRRHLWKEAGMGVLNKKSRTLTKKGRPASL